MVEDQLFKILLVEDDEDDYILIREMLRGIPNFRFKILWAPTYKEGLEKFQQEAVDVILIDYDLGQKNGIQWIREVVSLGADVPLVMVTGRGSYEKDIEAMKAGATDYLSKNDLTGFVLERAIRYSLERLSTEHLLEQRVREKTAELEEANHELNIAIEELRVYEEELQAQNETLNEYNLRLEKEIQRYQRLFNQSPFGECITDQHGHILETNPTFEKRVGRKGSYLKGRPLQVFIPDTDRGKVRSLINRIDGQTEPHQLAVHLLQADGTAAAALLTASALAARENGPQIRWIIQELALETQAMPSVPDLVKPAVQPGLPPVRVDFEWGEWGVRQLAPTSDVIILIDVLSFTTTVEMAVARGAWVYPYRTDGDGRSAEDFAAEIGGAAAGRRASGSAYSLSPHSVLEIPPGQRLVLPSPNGAALSLATGDTPTLAGCLRNAAAVARAAQEMGARMAVIASGERWPDGSLRPAFEDLVGAGAILSYLDGHLSPEAQAAVNAFEQARPRLNDLLLSCRSGQELVERDDEQGVALASELNVSDCVPTLQDGAYRCR